MRWNQLPVSMWAMVHKGMALMELAREDEASVVLHDALTIEPHDPAPAYAAGHSFHEAEAL